MRAPYLRGHERQRVHPVGVACDTAHHRQSTAGKQHGNQQRQNAAVAAHRCGGRKRELKHTKQGTEFVLLQGSVSRTERPEVNPDGCAGGSVLSRTAKCRAQKGVPLPDGQNSQEYDPTYRDLYHLIYQL